MAHSTTAAWGIPVKAKDTGPRVQSYAESQVVTQTFRLCVNHSQNQGNSLGAVPKEVIEMIASYVMEALIQSYSAEWEANISGCIGNWPLEFLFSEEEIIESCEELGLDYKTDDGQDNLWNQLMNPNESHIRGEERLRQFLGFIGLVENQRECAFAKYNKVIAKDFGLQVYFTKHETENQDKGRIINILAHLIKPSRHTTNLVDMRLKQFSYTSTLFIDQEDLLPGSSDLGPQFEKAMKKLGLKPFVHSIQCAASLPTSTALPTATDNPIGIGYDPMWKDNEKRKEELERSKWPKLVVLVHGAELSNWYF